MVALFGPLRAGAANPAQLVPSSFAQPSGGGSTLFTRLDPAATGLVVQNPYDDPQMWGARYRPYMGGAMGSGVAAGDYDSDGNVDLYVSTKTKGGRLFRNLGGWKFQDVTESAGLSGNSSLLGWMKNALNLDKAVVWGQGAVFADVNNDGRLDLYVCRSNAPNLLFINQDDGTFREEAEKRGLAVVDGSVVGAFADYDRDGWLDVLILTNQVEGTEPFGRADRLFHNRGDGTFTEVTAQAGILGETFGHAATWFDFDGDGWPDLAISNDFSGSDHLFHNNRDGTFTNVLDQVVPHTPYSSMGADAGDINNDGALDLFVADMATTNREKDRRGLAASRDDMLTVGLRPGIAPQYTRNALLLNTGTGIFGEAACWAGIEATDWTWSPRFEDFDNDGWQDLHVTNGMIREANNSDVLNRMMRALSDLERIGVMRQSPVLNEANLAYRNRHGEGFSPVTKEWGLDEVGVSFGSATADLDNDGDLDLVYINYNGGLSVYRNDARGSHRVDVRLRGTKSNRFGVGAVVRLESASTGQQTRELIVARGYASGSELVAHFGLGADTRISRLEVDWPSGIHQVFRDLEGDCRYLVTEAPAPAETTRAVPLPLYRSVPDAVGLKLQDKSTLAATDREQAFLPFRTDQRGPALAVADLDGDHHADIYVGSTTGSPARLLRWRNGAYAEERPAGIGASRTEDGPVLLFDADANGTRDLLVTKAGSATSVWPAAYQPVLYNNDGRGRFTATGRLPEIGLNVGAACAADIDGDGDLDLFLGGRSVPGRYPEHPRSLLLRNHEGSFADITGDSPELSSVGLVKSAVFRDVDQDGRPDLLLALEWDCVRYFHNEGNGRFSDWTARAGFTSGGRGWWNGIACGDFNRDGRLDFAVGNLGFNTTYRATTQKPVTLFYGDFAGNGTRLLAEAVYDGNRLYPARSRVDLGARLPVILRRFPRNDDFSRADLRQVFGEQAIAAAQKYEADNFASGVFLSQPEGTYRFSAFPREAQIGPMQGIVAIDADADGNLDLCAVQNSDIAVPQFDGGVGILLKGDGTGGFMTVPPRVSGIVIPGSGRALVLLDQTETSRPDLFLTRHGGTSECLADQAPRARWLKIVLRGKAGNSDGVGARVTISLSDGTSRYDETGLGGGWLSQGEPSLYAAVPDGLRILAAEVAWPDGRRSRHADVPAQGVWPLVEPDKP